jgi:hypothetical protein
MSNPTDTPTTPLGNPDCVVCGGDGAVPIVPHDAIAPGGPDELPCPFCHPELCNEHI